MSDYEYDYSDEEEEEEDDYEMGFSDDEEGEDHTDDTSKRTNDKHEVDFRAHTTKDLRSKMTEQGQKVAEFLGLSVSDTLTLLHTYQWNTEKLMEMYMDDPEGVKKKAGVSSTHNHGVKKGRVVYGDGSDFMCFICCEQKKESYILGCGHEFCIDCYRRYIADKVKQGNVVKCPSCDVALDHTDLDAIGGSGVSTELLDSSIKTYVERHKTYKWCPSPDCGQAIELINPSQVTALVEKHRVPVATCGNGHQFCLNCNYESHLPAPCDATERWITKCKDDSETVKWIVSNTKRCAKCDTSIEKNGGCNHMKCKKCAFEFCWICLGDWKHHGSQYYQCNRFKEVVEKKDDNTKVSAKLAKESLQRYLHFYNLFNIHETSMKQDSKRCAEVEDAVRELQEASGISWIEAQFLADAALTLLRTRRVLKWSYAFGYFCDKTPYLNIFEEVQAHLSQRVEALSKIFELEEPEDIVKSKLAFMNESRYATDAAKAMISCCDDAVINGTLNTASGR